MLMCLVGGCVLGVWGECGHVVQARAGRRVGATPRARQEDDRTTPLRQVHILKHLVPKATNTPPPSTTQAPLSLLPIVLLWRFLSVSVPWLI